MGDLDFGHWNFLGFLDTYLDSLDFLYIFENLVDTLGYHPS